MKNEAGGATNAAATGRGSEEKAAPRGKRESVPKKQRDAADGPVGAALRSAYQQTINEDVPPEFLALLNKLN